MRTDKKWLLFLILTLAMLLFGSIFMVREGQAALLLRLGKIEVDKKGTAIVSHPGLHAKLPLLNQVWKYTTRLQTLDIKSSRIVTAEKKDVIVDYYVKWRIHSPALFYTRTSGNVKQAQILLEQQLNDALRAEFGLRSISEVIADDRAHIMATLNQKANLSARTLGLEIIDVRIKRIDLPMEVSSAIFERMIAERGRIASEHRAQGKAKAEAIRANADAVATITVAKATTDSKTLRGEGEAIAAQIYAAAYQKDANFYKFYRSLIAYKHAFNDKRDILVLKPDSPFFKYFQGSGTAKKSK